MADAVPTGTKEDLPFWKAATNGWKHPADSVGHFQPLEYFENMIFFQIS